MMYDPDWHAVGAGWHLGNPNMPPRQEHHPAVALDPANYCLGTEAWEDGDGGSYVMNNRGFFHGTHADYARGEQVQKAQGVVGKNPDQKLPPNTALAVVSIPETRWNRRIALLKDADPRQLLRDPRRSARHEQFPRRVEHLDSFQERDLGGEPGLAAFQNVLLARTRGLDHLVNGAIALGEILVGEAEGDVVDDLGLLEGQEGPVVAARRK